MGPRLESFSFQAEDDDYLRGMMRFGDGDVPAARSTSALAQNRIQYWAADGLSQRRPGMLSTQSSCQSLYSEGDQPGMMRKKTRAVFNDLHTAHSKITGSTRSRFPGPSQLEVGHAPAYQEEESSIALDDLSALNDSSSSLLPVRPRAAAVSSLRRSRSSTQANLPEAKRRSQPTSWLEKRSGSGASSIVQNSAHEVGATSTFSSFKKAIGSITGFSAGNDRSNAYIASHWQKGSSDYIAEKLGAKRRHSFKKSETTSSLSSKRSASDSDLYRRAMDARVVNIDNGPNESSHYHSGPGGPPSDTLPHSLGRSIGPHGYGNGSQSLLRNDGSFLRDGSTVGNIYAHYMNREDTDGLSENDQSPPLPSRDYVNRRASGHGFPSSPPIPRLKKSHIALPSKPPPNFSLPKGAASQHLAVQQIAPSMSQAISHSSSYGDTAVLLDVGKELQITPVYPSGIKGGNPFIHTKTTPASKAPQVVVSPAECLPQRAENMPIARVGDRLPLEKEVSRALRRASGYSAFSAGSISTTPHERHEDLPSETSTYRAIKSLLRRNIEITPPSDTDSTKDEILRAGAQTRAFYDKRAMPSNWVSTQQQTVVRVPINQSSLPDSPPDSPPGDFETPFGPKQTTPDDHADWETVGESALGKPLTIDFLGGTVRRAGSSIANQSDEASARGTDLFHSSDRIAQHPGNNAYTGDYRQRNLKKAHIPIFLPVFREHKVNGYLADSTRMRPPPNPFYKTPPALPKPHENPFKSPAPQVMPGAQINRQRGRNTNLFPPSRGDKNRFVDQSADNPEWMNEFGQPGPMISNQSDQVLRATAPENSSLHNVIPYDGAHPPMGDTSTERDSAILEWRKRNRKDGFVEMQTYGGKAEGKKSRNPFVKGPPGAFYQGLRAVSATEGKCVSGSHQRDRTARAPSRNETAKNRPTNTLRPLSLLAGRRPSTPTGQVIQDPNESLENDFVYRSPLAPPRRNSWQQLYSEEQMKDIRAAAKADGFFSSQRSLSAGLRQSVRNLSSQKHLFEAPRLAIFSRDRSNQTGLVEQKKNFSTVVLCLCNLFPPFLVLYAIGALDGLVGWWTSGQCSTFAKGHKRAAFILLYVWCLLVLLGLIAFLVVWFVVLRPRGSV